MSTSGSFNPPDNPCPDQVFTRAALIALRDAGSLRADCHYRWTGPTIGTAGNTSPTVIESHATAVDELSMTAFVHTDFHESAWAGVVDIDAGEIRELTDHRNNIIRDNRAGAPSVHSQWPWHNDNCARNDASNGNFTGFGALTTQSFFGSRIDASVIDVTGAQSFMFMLGNEFVTASFTLKASTGIIRDCRFHAAAVNSDSTSRVDLVNCEFRTSAASIQVDAADTQGVSMIACDLNGYQISFARTGGGSASFVANEMIGTTSTTPLTEFHATFAGTGAVDMRECHIRSRTELTGPSTHHLTIDGAGAFSMNRANIRDSGTATLPGVGAIEGFVRTAASTGAVDIADMDFNAPCVYMDGAGLLDIGQSSALHDGTVIDYRSADNLSVQNSDLRGAAITLNAGSTGGLAMTTTRMAEGTVTKSGTGAMTFDRNTITAGTVTQNAASSATLTMQNNTQTNAIITLAAGSAGSVSLTSGNTGTANITHNGSGIVQMITNQGPQTVTTGAASTRGIRLTNCNGRGTVNQNGTGSTNLDIVSDMILSSGTINWNSTLAGTLTSTASGKVSGSSVVNIADGVTPAPMSQTEVSGASVLNVQPGGQVGRCRLAASATLNTGAFTHSNSIVDGHLTITPTTANTDKLASYDYNSWI